MTAESEQVSPPPVRDACPECGRSMDDMILLTDHNLIVTDLKAEYDAKIAHLNQVVQKLQDWGNGLQVKLASLSQELYRLKNLYPDLANMWKGVMKWGPDSFKNAMMLLAFLWSSHQTVFGMWKKANEKPKRPLWHYLMLGFVLIIVAGGWFEYLANPNTAGIAIAGAAPYLLIAFVAALVVFWQMNRRKTKQVYAPS